MNYRDLCLCGHNKVSHIGTPNKPVGQIIGSDYCWNYNTCKCKSFKLDNLKYLEDKYEQVNNNR